jgi:two-component system nitrogen regulation response regulator NtrX
MASDILIVDDEADIREMISGILSDEGYEARTACDSDQALAEIEARRPTLVILDIWLQGSRLDGLELLDILTNEHPELPVIIISGHGNIETAVSAIKRGAYNFIEKPFETDHLLHLIARATETIRLRRENEELKELTLQDREIIGRSPAIQTVRQMIDKVSATNSRVLITGAAGSGKEVVARQLHARSQRANAPFVVVNAANMAPERLEIELFGEEHGPVGTAGGRKIGLFEQAHGGTLFIDEVADMPPQTQSKILRVLVDQTFERVGGHTRVKVDVRVVSATSRDLRREIEQGRFREDLYHRLNVVPIRVPSLSERREDIPLLVDYFLSRVAATTGLPRCTIGEDALAALSSYEWPGNVRQLRNIVERLLILAGDDADGEITADLLPAEFDLPSATELKTPEGDAIMAAPLREAREAFEREYLRTQVVRFGGNISRTAAFIGMERSALHRKLKSLGLTVNERQKKNDS